MSSNKFASFSIIIFMILANVSNTVSAQYWQELNMGLEQGPRVLFSDSTSNLLWAGGNFVMADSVVVNGITKWDGADWHSVGIGLPDISPIADIASFKGEIYAGGFSGNGISRWNGMNWESLNGGANGSVFSLFSTDDWLYAAGWFDTIGGTPAHKIAKWNGTQWYSIDTTKWLASAIGCAIVYHNELYIGGNIVNWNGTIEGIARWNGQQWVSVGNGIRGGGSLPMSFEIYMDRLIVGGRFSLGEGNPGNAIASWNGIEWSELGGGIGGQNASIRDMEIHDGSLYVVGGFSSADGIPCSGIAKWDGLKWCCLGFDSPDGNGLFSTIQHQNSLYVGGAFKVIDTDSINSVAKWIGGSYVEACGNSTSMLEGNEPPHATISLYPNPANSSFTLTLPANTSTCTLKIHDITGREVAASRTYRAGDPPVDVTHLSAGLYFVEVRVKDRVEVIKLVKE